MDYTNEHLQRIIDTATALQHANDDLAAASDALDVAQAAVEDSTALVSDLKKQFNELTAPAPAPARYRR